MRALAPLVLLFGIVFVAGSGCRGGAPRMATAPSKPHAGESVVVRFDAPVVSRGMDQVWVTLVPASSPEGFLIDRVIVDDGAMEVVVPAPAEGVFELRLHDAYPRRRHHLVGRVRVEVERPGVAQAEPPPWYW